MTEFDRNQLKQHTQVMPDLIKEVRKCYPDTDEQILKVIQMALGTLPIAVDDINKIMYMLALACEKHFEQGYAVGSNTL